MSLGVKFGEVKHGSVCICKAFLGCVPGFSQSARAIANKIFQSVALASRISQSRSRLVSLSCRRLEK